MSESPDEEPLGEVEDFEGRHQLLILSEKWVKLKVDWFEQRQRGGHIPPSLLSIVVHDVEAVAIHFEEPAIMQYAEVIGDMMYLAFKLGQQCGKDGTELVPCPCGGGDGCTQPADDGS